MTAEPTAEERAAVDALLGAPTTGWDGGARTAARPPRGARARGQSDIAAAGAARPPGADRLDQRGRAELRVRTPVGAARRGLRGRDVLCDVQRRAAARHRAARLRRPRLSHPRGRRHGGASRRRMRRRSEGGPEPLSRLVRGGAGGVVPGGGRGSHVPRRGAGRRRTRSLRRSTARGRSCRRPRWRRVTAGSGCCARVGAVDPTSLHDYRAHGGYAALARAIELGPDAVIQQVTNAKLLGRGGAAFPTGVKWRAVADQPGSPKYVVATPTNRSPAPSRIACSWRTIRSR